jgi:hypothetical protein
MTVNVELLVRKLIELIEVRKSHGDTGFEKLLQLIANVTENENESDADEDGMGHDLGDYGG